MALETIPSPVERVSLHGASETTPTREFAQLYTRMRAAIADVFPNTSEAWNFQTGFGEQGRTPPPPATAKEWLPGWLKTDPFCRALAQRYITLWQQLEGRDFAANGKQLYPHQRALFSWLTIGGLVSGTRDRLPAILIRSPYGSGKSLVGGLVMEGMQDLILETALERVTDRTPRAAMVGLRRDLLIQNGLGGETYVAQRPPYHFAKEHARSLHRQMQEAYGPLFVQYFGTQLLPKSRWFELCGVGRTKSEEADDAIPSATERLQGYLGERYGDLTRQNRGLEMLGVLTRVLDGASVVLPTVRGALRELPAPKRLGELGAQFKGDMAYAIHRDLPMRATHRHLLPDPERYSTELDPAAPALMGIFTGASIGRDREKLRRDVHDLLQHTRLVLADEAGKLTPSALRKNLDHGTKTVVVGLAATEGQQTTLGDWVRSPCLDVGRSVELRITKPISFAFIGHQGERHAPGSTEAWKQYETALFTDAPLLSKLKLPQPYEVNGLVIVPSSAIQAFALRLEQAYAERQLPVEVYRYDTSIGPDRWKQIEYTLRGTAGKVPRKIVTTANFIGTGTNLQIDSIDVLAKVRPEDLHQLLGRLYHQRNMTGKAGARTYFRQQAFDTTTPIVLERVAKEMGIDLPTEGALWRPFQCAIDRSAKEEDDRRRGLPPAEPVPQYTAIAKQVRGPKAGPRPTPASAPASRAKPVPNPRVVEDDDEDDKQMEMPRVAEDARNQAFSLPSATAGTVRVDVRMEANGTISDETLQSIAYHHEVGSYVSALNVAYEQAYIRGVRGRALAEAVANKVVQLKEARLRRKQS